jgi:hypothetical protein
VLIALLIRHWGGAASVITSKPAIRDWAKTGQGRPSGIKLFYAACSASGKPVLVRQLRGPHFSRCP